MSKRLKQILIVLILTLPAMAYSQEADKFNRNPAKRQREMDKKKIEQAKADEKALQELKKQHYKNQSKEVRKRMKKTNKRSSNHNNNKGKSPFKRLFRSKR